MIERYSEQSYVCKQEIIEEFGYHIGNVMWSEIEAYRNRFLFEIPESNMYVIMCRNVVFSILKTERKLYQINERMYKSTNDEQQKSWDILAHQLETMKYLDLQLWCQEACGLLRLKQETDIVRLFAMDLPLTLLLFLCYLKFHEQGESVVKLYLMRENLLYMQTYIPTYSDINTDLCSQLDITYNFFQFLEQIQLKICDRMVLLNSIKNENQLTLTFEELKECYPQLCDDQIRFYLEHCKKEHYYNIQQYLQFSNVCYETARSSMDKLVEMCWYKKRKLGKKFVYYI